LNRSGILSRSGSALLFLSSYPSNLHWLPRLRLSLSVSCSFMVLDGFFKIIQLADFFLSRTGLDQLMMGSVTAKVARTLLPSREKLIRLVWRFC